MTAFLLKRIAGLVPVLFGISVITFCLILIVPGDPVAILLGDGASASAISALREQLHLNGNIFSRYGGWIWDVLHGDFGNSIATGRPAGSVMATALGHTVKLAMAAMIIAVLAGMAAGMLSARYHRRKLGTVVDVVSITGLSIPNFWLGLLLLYVFSLQLGWFPVGGLGPIQSHIGFLDNLNYVVLPAIAVAALPASFIARLTRTLVLEVQNQDFVLTLRTRGYSNARIWRHILRNGAPGIINVVGLQAGDLILGAVFVEVIFNWPGIGTALLTAINSRDYPVIQAVILVVGGLFAVLTLLTDTAIRAVDPRTQAT